MGVAFHISKRMVFAMYGNPFFGLDSCGEPQDGAKNKGRVRMDTQGPMAQCSVEVHRCAGVGHRRDDEGSDQCGQDRVHLSRVHHYLPVGRQSRR